MEAGEGLIQTQPEEMCPSGGPKEEFGRMIFEKKSSLGDTGRTRQTKKTPKKGKHSLICGPE